MSLSPAIAIVLLSLVSVRAALGAPPARGRFELRAGAGWRSDTVAQPQVDTRASGGAVSELGARLAWFGTRSHLGAAARLRATRFALAGTGGMAPPGPIDLTGLDGAGALAGRLWFGPVELEGQLGYGYLRVPVVAVTAGPAGDARFTGSALRGHGPVAGATVRVALGERAWLEAGGDAAPVLFAARHGEVAVSPRRWGAHAGLGVDCCDLGGARWSIGVSYELARTTAGGAALAIAQRQHQVGLGLRATWREPVVTQPAPAPAPVVERRPPPVVPSAISGVVRAEGGQAVIARISLMEAGLTTATDPQGGFRFDVPPGQYTLTIEAEGYLPQRKPVAAGPGEQRIYNIELRRPAP